MELGACKREGDWYQRAFEWNYRFRPPPSAANRSALQHALGELSCCGHRLSRGLAAVLPKLNVVGSSPIARSIVSQGFACRAQPRRRSAIPPWGFRRPCRIATQPAPRREARHEGQARHPDDRGAEWKVELERSHDAADHGQ